MKAFIHEDFLLQNEFARELYHETAQHQPIFDYHCHLSPAEIAGNKRWSDLSEIWLGGDHYKWRAMRSNGVAEKFCTGDASPREKFQAWSATVPRLLRNPLYHWTHMELKAFFGIDELLDEDSAESIWQEANRQIAGSDFCVQSILDKFRVVGICTTDDPVDSLEHHKAIKEQGINTKVYPTFRPDKAFGVDQPEAFNAWKDQLALVSGRSIHHLDDFLAALKDRHDFFHSLGGRLSDHGLERCFIGPCSEEEAAAILKKVMRGEAASQEEKEKFGFYMMVFFGRLDAAKGWTKQLHLGAMRNNNTRLFQKLGADTGFDSIGDYPQAKALSQTLDALDRTGECPRVILYNLNPADNYVLATMLGNFQDGTIAGKIQFGSGWWFLDQKEGMEWQMNALSNLGLLSRFVGMLTDSRSFLSWPRHDYFRRILCNLVGNDVVSGILPRKTDLLHGMIADICFHNAREYLQMETGN